MASWQGKSRASRSGYQIFVWVLRRLGVEAAYLMLRLVAFYYFLFSWETSRPVLQFYRERLKMGRWKSLLTLYRNYYKLGQNLIDKVVVMAGIPNKLTAQSNGLENLREIASEKKGGILMSAHLGNWELAGHFLHEHLPGIINIVMFDGEQEAIKNYLEEVTGPRRVNVILIKDDNSHIYNIYNALSKNELVAIHGDRYLPGNKTISGQFLGKTAKFPEGPFLLAAKFKVPVSFVFAFKQSDTTYQLYGSPKLELFKGHQHDPALLLDAFVQELEAKLKLYPEQWFNYFYFWGEEK
ncbi:MAG: lipid A biosynthesis acyltransferase [Lewinellaceae bacterium]|nr:hypothetical protein [Saprospiraceae bacterium]MCB9337032.1 lipid A biosynthesis acyltransferase [Lewinellaceae bacterium]